MSEQEHKPGQVDRLASILRGGFHETPAPGPWHEQIMLRRLSAGEGRFRNVRQFLTGSASGNQRRGIIMALLVAAGLGVILLTWPTGETVKDNQDYAAEMVLIEKYAEVFEDLDEEPQYTASVAW